MPVSDEPQYQQVANLLEKRIRHGDYLLKELPASRSLALEMGVSHIVARKAVEKLTQQGLLTRLPNGRLSARNVLVQGEERQARLALVAPAFLSPAFQFYRVPVEHAADKIGALLRPVDFVHWDDPVFDDVLDGFDGMFVIPSAESIPRNVAERLSSSDCRVATFDVPLVEFGIPVIHAFEPSCIHNLMNHLYELGHRRIGCFNTQPEGPTILDRIGVWRQWMKERELPAMLISNPVPQYERPIVQAHETGKRMLRQVLSDCTAIFCPTESAAKGLMRAMADLGIVPGRDLSVCTMDDEGEASYTVPSITSILVSDLSGRVNRVLDWMIHPERPWTGDLKLEGEGPKLFIGESTGPVKA